MNQEALKILNERFSRDTLIALATIEGQKPFVRTVNAFYEDGAFYVITHAQSQKMRQIAQNPAVAISGDWFTAQGTAENLGHVLKDENRNIMEKLRNAFSSWYHNGHVNEQNENTCLLCIHLTRGILFSHGTRYDLQFE